MASSPRLAVPAPNYPRSLFFTLPLEIRYLIYGLILDGWEKELHLSRRNGKFQTSKCMGAEDDRESMREREGMNNNYAACGRRLASGWGPHWKCEDSLLASLEEDRLDSSSMLLAPCLPIFQTCHQL